MNIPAHIEKEIVELAVGWFVSPEGHEPLDFDEVLETLSEGKVSEDKWMLWYPFEGDDPTHVAEMADDLAGHVRRIVLLALKEKDLRSE